VSAGRQWGIVAAVVVVIAGGAVVATMNADRGGAVGPGSLAPAFAAVTVPVAGAGAARSIDAYRGKPVLLNVWATWCNPCRDEMPRIQKLYEELGSQGLAVVAVSVDNPGMEAEIRSFTKEMGLSFDILYDASGRIRDDYQTAGVPETFLIDKEGVIRRRLIGSSWTVDEQRPLLRELLAEPAPGAK
jgi:peroxiredoxin